MAQESHERESASQGPEAAGGEGSNPTSMCCPCDFSSPSQWGPETLLTLPHRLWGCTCTGRAPCPPSVGPRNRKWNEPKPRTETNYYHSK